MNPSLQCALCLCLLVPRRVPALTVMNGSAVCVDHLGYMRAETLDRSIELAREREQIIEEADLIERAFSDEGSK